MYIKVRNYSSVPTTVLYTTNSPVYSQITKLEYETRYRTSKVKVYLKPQNLKAESNQVYQAFLTHIPNVILVGN